MPFTPCAKFPDMFGLIVDYTVSSISQSVYSNIRTILFWSVKLYISFFFIVNFFLLHHAACGILIPQPGSNPHPLQWEHGILTTGPPGKSLQRYVSILVCLVPYHSSLVQFFKSNLLVHRKENINWSKIWKDTHPCKIQLEIRSTRRYCFFM